MRSSFFRRLAICGLLAWAGSCVADTIGKTYPIVEPDMLEEIHRKLAKKEASGELASLERRAIARSMESAEAPAAVTGIKRATKARVYYFDPTYINPKSITDQSGRIISPAGTVVNPLDYVNLPRRLLFFDARDDAQVLRAQELMRRFDGMVKPILVGGRVGDLMRLWKTRLYFDQGGSLSKRLNISHTPAVVSQDGRRLRIEEVAVE